MTRSRACLAAVAHPGAGWLTALVLLAALTGCRADQAARGSGVACEPAPVQPEVRVPHSPSPIAPTASDALCEAMDRYYFSTCPMCSTLLGAKGEAIEKQHAGRHLRFCTGACERAFDADSAGSIARIDAMVIADQRPHYPGMRSLFDDRGPGTGGIEFVWGNRMFRAADEAERARILADPAEAQRRLDEAVVRAQTPTYGMPDKCPVQGDILTNDSRIDIVVANRMIRVCCGRCVKVVRARPYQYLAMVNYANREAARARAHKGEDR